MFGLSSSNYLRERKQDTMIWSRKLYRAEKKYYKELAKFQEKHLPTGKENMKICSIANLTDDIANDCMTGPNLIEYIPKSKILQHLYNDILKVDSLISRIHEDIEKYGISLIYDEGTSKYISCEHVDYTTSCISDLSLSTAKFTTIEYPDGSRYKIDDFSTLKHFINYLIDLSNSLHTQYDINLKGEQGEQAVSNYLSMLEYKYTIKQNVILPADGLGSETAETDAYIISDKGVFVCEIKNWGNSNSIIQVTNGGQWLKLSRDRRILETLKSPIEQNTKHCIATDRFLRAHGIANAKIIPMVIMADDGAIIDNQSSNIVLKISDVYNFVESYNGGSILDNNTQERIAYLFDESTNNIPERRFQVISYSPYAERFEQVYELLRDNSIKNYQSISKMEDLYQKNVAPIYRKYNYNCSDMGQGITLILFIVLTLLIGIFLLYYLNTQIIVDTELVKVKGRWLGNLIMLCVIGCIGYGLTYVLEFVRALFIWIFVEPIVKISSKKWTDWVSNYITLEEYYK